LEKKSRPFFSFFLSFFLSSSPAKRITPPGKMALPTKSFSVGLNVFYLFFFPFSKRLIFLFPYNRKMGLMNAYRSAAAAWMGDHQPHGSASTLHTRGCH
jgi:hypothetical protein